MWNAEQQNDQSIIDLIASDAAYEKENQAHIGQFLSTFPDSAKDEEYDFPLNLIGNTNIQYSILQAGFAPAVLSLTKWTLVKTYEVGKVGFGAQLYEGIVDSIDGISHTEYVLAFRGTDGRDGKDWYSNLALATDQWREANQTGDLDRNVIDSLFRTIDLDNPDHIPSNSIIHFTGQSMGGALAQYAAYQYAKRKTDPQNTAFDSTFTADKMTLTTFNSLGGIEGLKDLEKNKLNFPLLTFLRDVPTAHYVIPNEIVHFLGGGFLNGTGNTYAFDSWKAWQDGRETAYQPGLVQGHRIESGFYQGFELYHASFLSANPYRFSSVNIGQFREIGVIFSRISAFKNPTEISSWARMVTGLSMGALLGAP